MKIGPTLIEDTFAEAFPMRYTRLIVTAVDRFWTDTAVSAFCGYATSVIGCDAESGLEQILEPTMTDDGRCGASILAFGLSAESLGKAVVNRCGQTLLTCPTTAVFNGLLPTDAAAEEAVNQIPLGRNLRFFGDGFQKSKRPGDRRFWRIPVMDGEFLVEESVGIAKGIGGGNFLIQATSQAVGLAAARRAVDAIAELPGVITPFPGGIVRSGSKVGSRYDGLVASTAETYCPTLKGRVESALADEVSCVYEIVIDGISFEAISRAIATGIRAAVGDGVVAIGAGNYGGKLGKHHFRLHEAISADG